MKNTIYLPSSAIRQLETSDDSSVWARPIPYSDKPSKQFSLSLTYDSKDERFYDSTEDGMFFPDRTEPDTVLELLAEVDSSKIEKILKQQKAQQIQAKQDSVGKFSDAIYRCFLGVADAECWARHHNGEIEVFSQHVYHFSGFGHVSSFSRHQEECLDRVLTEGAGLALNSKELKLLDGSYDFGGKFPNKDLRFAYTEEDFVSIDGKTYKLFQDHDGGARGWALFTVRPKNRVKVLYEDHCDNVRDWMLADNLAFLKELGLDVNFKFLDRHNHEFYEAEFVPTVTDFESDFHINEKGRKKKA